MILRYLILHVHSSLNVSDHGVAHRALTEDTDALGV